MYVSNQLSMRIAITVAALGIATIAIPDARAEIRLNANAGGVCKAASGTGASVFYFDSQLVQNTSANVQYLTCLIPEINPTSARGALDIQVVFENPTAASISFICVIQAGYHGYGVNNLSYVTSVSSHGVGQISSAGPARTNEYSPYTLSCAVPAQGQVGLITVRYPESLTP